MLEEYGKPLKIREWPVPEIEQGAILVKIEMAGISETDVHQWQGNLGFKAPLPNIPGHETIGRVAKLAADKILDRMGNKLEIGDRIMWAHLSCGKCFWCEVVHQPNLCKNRIYYGIRNSSAFPYLTGGFSEYEYLLPGTEIVKLPEDLKNEEIIGVSCALRTVVSAFERLKGIGV